MQLASWLKRVRGIQQLYGELRGLVENRMIRDYIGSVTSPTKRDQRLSFQMSPANLAQDKPGLADLGAVKVCLANFIDAGRCVAARTFVAPEEFVSSWIVSTALKELPFARKYQLHKIFMYRSTNYPGDLQVLLVEHVTDCSR